MEFFDQDEKLIKVPGENVKVSGNQGIPGTVSSIVNGKTKVGLQISLH